MTSTMAAQMSMRPRVARSLAITNTAKPGSTHPTRDGVRRRVARTRPAPMPAHTAAHALIATMRYARQSASLK